MSECECSPTKKFLHFYEIKTVQEEQEQQTVEVDIEPYDLAPAMNGTATAGSSENYARGDHVHPRDTTKVDKVDGMGLSSNDYTSEEKAKLSALKDLQYLSQLSNDQGFISDYSYVHTDNNYTTEEKTKLAGLSSYSAATTSVDGLMSSSDKTKLDGIESGAEANVIEVIKVNGTTQAITDKTVDLIISGGGSGTGEENVIEVVQVNGTALTVTNKTVNVTVPTQTSQLTNNSDFVTTTQMNTAIATAISGAINSSY